MCASSSASLTSPADGRAARMGGMLTSPRRVRIYCPYCPAEALRGCLLASCLLPHGHLGLPQPFPLWPAVPSSHFIAALPASVASVPPAR